MTLLPPPPFLGSRPTRLANFLILLSIEELLFKSSSSPPSLLFLSVRIAVDVLLLLYLFFVCSLLDLLLLPYHSLVLISSANGTRFFVLLTHLRTRRVGACPFAAECGLAARFLILQVPVGACDMSTELFVVC